MKLLKTFLELLYFRNETILKLKEISSYKYGIILFLIVILLQSMPVSAEDFLRFHIDFPTIALGFSAAFILSFLFAKMMKSKVNLKNFLFCIGAVGVSAMILINILTYLSILIFEIVLDNFLISNFVTSFLPFYWVIGFGYSAEVASELKGLRSILVALVSIGLLFSFYFLFL